MIHSELIESEHLSGVKVSCEGSRVTLMKEFLGIIETLLQNSDLELLTLECMLQAAQKRAEEKMKKGDK